MQLLRRSTRRAHLQVEQSVLAMGMLVGRAGYRRYLRAMYGFVAPTEALLGASEPLHAGLLDLDARRKTPWLEDDLRALGDDPHTLPLAPPPDDLRGGAAFGCAYVLEGSTLGGRTLAPRVEARLGLTAEHGARFVSGYGELTESRWAGFAAALEHHAALARDDDAIVAGANAAFERLRAWLERSDSGC